MILVKAMMIKNVIVMIINIWLNYKDKSFNVLNKLSLNALYIKILLLVKTVNKGPQKVSMERNANVVIIIGW